jgi:ribosomal protein L11 methyltransferase
MDEKPNWKAVFSVDKGDVLDVMTALEEAMSNAPTSVSTFEDTSDGSWHAEGLYIERPNAGDLHGLIESFGHGDVLITALEDEDWIAKSLKDLQPVRAGRFFIHGEHNEASTASWHWISALTKNRLQMH